MFTYDFRVKLENGEDLKFRVPSNVIMMDSPLKGYKSANGTRPMLDITNRLVYSPLDKAVLRKLLIFCGVSLLVGLLIGAGVMFAIGKVSPIFDQAPAVNMTVTTESDEIAETLENEKVVEVKADSVVVQQPVETELAAVKYLQDSEVWNRTAMEEYDSLKGLWDALNTRSFKKLTDKKFDCLLGSTKFKRLRDAAKQLASKTWSSNYTSPGDEDITIEPYIKKLENLAISDN